MKKFILLESDIREIKSMYGLINEQSSEQITDPKIVNAVNSVLKRLMSSPKFGTDDTL